MAERSVIWTQTAARQRRAVLQYWLDRNQSTAYPVKLISAVQNRIQHILRHPLSFPLTSFPNTRTCSLGHYSILYQVSDQQIIITAFWDNRQDPKRLKRLLEE